jgi:hypothetical protein
MGRSLLKACAALLAIGAAAASPRSLAAQVGGSYDRYRAQYGDPVDVSISDLAMQGSSYRGRAIRTRGVMELDMQSGSGGAGRRYYLKDNFLNAVAIYPVAEVSVNFETEAMEFTGREVEVTGLFNEVQASSSTIAGGRLIGSITFWAYTGPEDDDKKKAPVKAETVTLESLVGRAGRFDGRTVRVVGKFRGKNLYGDLPGSSARRSSDWVIKDDVYAVWVTGKKPKGSGWQLDPGLKRDTGKWLEVVGRPETRSGIVYIAAMEVRLTSPPAESKVAEVKDPSPPPERPKVPPHVVFALPLDNETSVAPDARFALQFSKDMDEVTFKGRVALRYAGPVRPGDRPFEGMRATYDGGRRALLVDPGDMLKPGRIVELLLLPGILDSDGLELLPRGGEPPEGTADVFRYRVGP